MTTTDREITDLAARGLRADFVARTKAMRDAHPGLATDGAMFRHIERTPLTEAIDWVWHAIASRHDGITTASATEALGTTATALSDAWDRMGYGPLFD